MATGAAVTVMLTAREHRAGSFTALDFPDALVIGSRPLSVRRLRANEESSSREHRSSRRVAALVWRWPNAEDRCGSSTQFGSTFHPAGREDVRRFLSCCSPQCRVAREAFRIASPDYMSQSACESDQGCTCVRSWKRRTFARSRLAVRTGSGWLGMSHMCGARE